MNLDDLKLRAKEVQYIIDYKFHFTSISDINKLLHELENYIRDLQLVTKEITEVYAAGKSRLDDRLSHFKSLTTPLVLTDPTQMSPVAPEEIKIDDVKNAISQTDSKNVTPDIKLQQIKIVQFIEDLPDTPLCWIENSREFAVKITGQVFRGHIGEIYPTSNKIITGMSPFSNVTMCSYGAKCRNMATCSYYHDPNLIPDEIKDKQIRNYTNGNWVYGTRDSKTNSTMRHIGSRPNMLIDLKNVTKKEATNWMHQTIHCILVSLCINRHLDVAAAQTASTQTTQTTPRK